jgi:hypothetical protein
MEEDVQVCLKSALDRDEQSASSCGHYVPLLKALSKDYLIALQAQSRDRLLGIPASNPVTISTELPELGSCNPKFPVNAWTT